MDELIKQEGGELVSLIEEKNLGDIIKPLVREIHLFDSFIAGTSYLSDKSVLNEVKIGDKINLLREDNKFDSNAILLITESKKKIGYIPEKDNVIFARLMDAGKLIIAKINNIEQKGTFTKIGISIYLTDF